MKVEIREIGNDVDNKKRVAFTITSDNEQKYLIDKSVTILSGKTNDDYIKEKIKFALNIKPKQHDFMIGEKINKYMKRHMNVTGG